MSFWIHNNGVWGGPHSYDLLKANLENGSLPPETLVSVNPEGRDARKLGQMISFTETMVFSKTSNDEIETGTLSRNLFSINGNWVAVDGCGTPHKPYVIFCVENNVPRAVAAELLMMNKLFGENYEKAHSGVVSLPNGRSGAFKTAVIETKVQTVYFDIGEAMGEGTLKNAKPQQRYIDELSNDAKQALIKDIRKRFAGQELDDMLAVHLIEEALSNESFGLTEVSDFEEAIKKNRRKRNSEALNPKNHRPRSPSDSVEKMEPAPTNEHPKSVSLGEAFTLRVLQLILFLIMFGLSFTAFGFLLLLYIASETQNPDLIMDPGPRSIILIVCALVTWPLSVHLSKSWYFKFKFFAQNPAKGMGIDVDR